MDNKGFLNVVRESFLAFVESGSSRSTQKLKPLHGAIAHDLQQRLGEEYVVKGQGFGDGKEEVVRGRYLDKRVDIAVLCGGEAVAGIGVKFVMQNHAQNANNYFENMLGETANIRSAGLPYFQVFAIPDRLPHYDKSKVITGWETFGELAAKKYATLSHDRESRFCHVPSKTLLYVVHLPPCSEAANQMEYFRFFLERSFDVSAMDVGSLGFGPSVILNDYETFMNKVYHTIRAL